MLFDRLPVVQILELALKILGHPKLAIINNRIHQTFPYKTLGEDIPLICFYTCNYTFSIGEYIDDQEQVGFGRVEFIHVLPFLDSKES
jgi:hypothetical protein